MLLKILSCALYKSSLFSTGFAKQIMPILRILCYNGSLVAWTVIRLTTAKFKPRIFYVCRRLVLCCKYFHSQDSVWLLLVACIILFYNCLHRGVWKPCANCGPVCTFKNLQWCGEPWFLGAAILRGRSLPLIPRRGKHTRHYWPNQYFMES
jgi:hypothetical protein